ncbi:MAG: HMA2 domain-containing protein [Bryobacteraceae bacterium]
MQLCSKRGATRTVYVHHVPGRLRVRSVLVKKNEYTASEVKRLMEAMPGVRSASTNTLTGSVTIAYDGAVIDRDTLLGVLREKGYLTEHDHVCTPACQSAGPALRIEVSGKVAKVVAAYVVEKAVERSVAALIAAVL